MRLLAFSDPKKRKKANSMKEREQEPKLLNEQGSKKTSYTFIRNQRIAFPPLHQILKTVIQRRLQGDSRGVIWQERRSHEGPIRHRFVFQPIKNSLRMADIAHGAG